jgi:D-beta-D-heptose 7-phosphate kinase/D-beta-D-heptose 1-phosphate adenosyltransferase
LSRGELAESAPLITAEELVGWAQEQRDAGRSIAFTNGCFDLLHEGHVRSLQFAAQQADTLIVAMNSDLGVRALKGEGRPVVGEKARSLLLRSLRCVDGVTIFDAPSVLDTLLQIRPDILAKGGEYSEDEIVGSAEIKQWGGKIVRIPMIDGVDTTTIVSRIRGDA